MITEESKQWKDFLEDLPCIINRNNIEALYDCNVPDYILANVAANSIMQFAFEYNRCKEHYGVILEPGHKAIKEGF